jgi:hypothetical protein
MGLEFLRMISCVTESLRGAPLRVIISALLLAYSSTGSAAEQYDALVNCYVGARLGAIYALTDEQQNQLWAEMERFRVAVARASRANGIEDDVQFVESIEATWASYATLALEAHISIESVRETYTRTCKPILAFVDSR